MGLGYAIHVPDIHNEHFERIVQRILRRFSFVLKYLSDKWKLLWRFLNLPSYVRRQQNMCGCVPITRFRTLWTNNNISRCILITGHIIHSYYFWIPWNCFIVHLQTKRRSFLSFRYSGGFRLMLLYSTWYILIIERAQAPGSAYEVFTSDDT